MKILITGIAGFIGSHLADRLHLLGHEILGIDNFSAYYNIGFKKENAQHLKSFGIQIIEDDLRSEDFKSKLPLNLDYIFHCAAQPGIAKTSTFEDYLSNNIVATNNLISFAEQCPNLKFFINIGTSSIYGAEVSCSENEVTKPISNYGITKLAAEQLVLLQSRRGFFQACSLRLYSVYGSRERPDKMFSQLIDCAINKKAFPLFKGSLEHQRSFTHIKDIIDGIISVIGNEEKCDGQIINLGTTQEYSTKQAIKIVEDLLSTRIHIQEEPPRPGDQIRTKAVIDKAQYLLNYHPSIGLREGVLEQINWMKNKNNKKKMSK